MSKSRSAKKMKDFAGNNSPSATKGKYIPLTMKLVDTGEVFTLKNITPTMTIRELKSYLEFCTGIPVSLQRLHYLDEADLQEHTDIKSNDIVAGGQLHMAIWHAWIKLINAVVQNNISEVLKMGVTPDSSFRTPNSNYMNAKGVQAWLAERAFIALFVASHRGHVKMVQTLVDSGAELNTKTSLGRTPLHVAAAQGRGSIVDILLNNGADVNEVDKNNDSALAIAERFGHKDGARHLFLFRWQVRAAQAEKVAQLPMYYHQQCDTANPVWLSGQQGQLYYAAKDKHVDEYAGTGFSSGPATQKPTEIEPEDRVKLKIAYDDWLSEKKRREEIKLAVVKAEKAAKKLEEEKRKDQNLIDKESYDTWVQKQQDQKERQAELKQKKAEVAARKGTLGSNRTLAGSNINLVGAGGKERGSKGVNSLRSSDNFEAGGGNDEDESQLSDLIAHVRNTKLLSATYDDLVFQNEFETFEKVRSIQHKRATDKRNHSVVPML